MTRLACVVGAGLAGTFAVKTLLEGGWNVRWVESSPQPAPRASGNPAGIFKPILTPTATPPSLLSFLAFDELVKQLAEWEAQGLVVPHSRRGLLQVALTEDEEGRFRRSLQDRQIPSEVAAFREAKWVSEQIGVPHARGGVWFPQGGWIDPGALCRTLFDSLKARYASSGQLELRFGSSFQQGDLEGTDSVVFCTAEASRDLAEFQSLKTQVIRGQLSVLKLGDAVSQTDFPVSFHEYWIPTGDGHVVVGATHDRDDEGTDARLEDHRRLLERVGSYLPEAWKDLSEVRTPESMRAGLRFTRASHLPVVGALPETSRAMDVSAYAFTALGSRGILLAPLLSRQLLSLIEPGRAVLPEALGQALSPFQSLLQKG